MKKKLTLILVTTLVLLYYSTLANAQDDTRARELLDKVDPSNYPTPIYHRYLDATGTQIELLVAEALASNIELKAIRQKKDILQAKRLQAGLRPNPKIDIEFLTDELSSRSGEYDFNATYLQPIERGDKRNKRIKIIDLELIKLEKEIIFQEQQLRSQILTQCAYALTNGEQLRLLERLVKLSEENFRIVEVKFKEGDVAKLDLQLTELELNRWKIELLQTELELKTNLTQIKFLLGLETRSYLALLPSFPIEPTTLNISELQTLALENRADLQSARISQEIVQAEIELAQVQAKPDIELFFKYTEERKTENIGLNKLSSTNRKIGGGVSFALPFYNRNQGQIAEFSASKMQVNYLRDQLEQSIKQEVALAFAKFENAQQSIELFRISILPKAQKSVDILQAAYLLGDQDLLPIITQQRHFIESQKEYFLVYREYYLSLIALEKAVGKTIN